MSNVKKHFVQFYSPGTFVAEITEKPIGSWDIEVAKEMAHNVLERHNATPYGFKFITREQKCCEFNSEQIASSSMYYLGGKVETVEELEIRNDPEEEILRCNMRNDNWNRIITNTNSWKWTQPLNDGDVVLEFVPKRNSHANQSQS